jgi:hypothetical protein
MPALPTFTVTQAQADRLIAAFGSADAYKAWLKNQIVSYVVNKEMESANDALRQQFLDKRAEIDNLM